MVEYRVEDFGRDCLGNITGYRVCAGHGAQLVVKGIFCGDIYKYGSFMTAKCRADTFCKQLNADESGKGKA